MNENIEELIKDKSGYQKELLRENYNIVKGLQAAIVRDLKIFGHSEVYIQKRIVDRLQLIIQSAGAIGRIIENHVYYHELYRLNLEKNKLQRKYKSLSSMYSKLQKENEELRQQVEILKKAAAYFAKESKND